MISDLDLAISALRSAIDDSQAELRADRDRLAAELREAREERDRIEQDFKMYRNAWAREIGPSFYWKAHDIDMLVKTTQERMSELKRLQEAAALKAAPPRVLGLPSVEELEQLLLDAMRGYDGWAKVATRLHAALSARRPASPVGLDEERLAEALIQADLLASHTSFAQSRKHAAKLISAYGATALPPIPEGDAGPRALHEAYRKSHHASGVWDDIWETVKEARRAQWLAAVAILRPDAATGKGGGE